jgi:tetratricopeptide (TPR) repeat protein
MSERDPEPTEEVRDDGDEEVRDHGGGDEPRDPLKRKIAITLASLVLVGAGLAILQTDAGVNESNTARETTREAVRAMRENVAQNAVLGVVAELQGERDFLRYRSPLAEGASLSDAVGIPPNGARIASDLRAAEKGLPIARGQQALDRLGFAAERATLKQRALATTRVTWNTRSTQYTTVIAVLAAALFLVGLGLVVEGALRRYVYALGVAVALFATAWAVWIYKLPIPTTPDSAIDASARASVLANRLDYPGAIDLYSRAIAADGAFAAPYTGRAIARLLAANPDYRASRAYTDVRGRASGLASRDIGRALDLGGQRDFLGLGVSALLDFYGGRYRQSVDEADRAIAINPGVPDAWLLKSAAHLALGEETASDAARRKALDLLKGAQPSKQVRLLSSTYLSYLAWIARYRPTQAAAARQASNEVVAAETRFTLGRTLSDSLPRSGSVSVDDLRYANGRLELRLGYDRLPKGTVLTALAYERPIKGGAWAQPTDLALFLDVAGSGKEKFSIPLVRACKPTEVRVDVFLNGVPALSRTGPGVKATC